VAAYVILFRGVGGATQLPTAPLREALTEAGFGQVATYINSGNAILASDLPRGQMIATVAEICATRFGFRKDIHARTHAEWADLVARNPFPDATAEPTSLHAAVLEGEPETARIETLQGLAQNGERLAIVGGVAYLHTPDGFGTSRLAARFDKGLGVPNTARNWNTVLRLLAMVKAADRA
jgi:uncharacterized protein (DUF1697 family)